MGIPKRVLSTAYFCNAFNAFAPDWGFSPVSKVFCVHGSARSTAQKEPMGAALIRSLYSSEGTTPLDVLVYISHPSGQHSCPIFSSTVIRPSKSFTLLSTGAEDCLYKGVCADTWTAQITKQVVNILFIFIDSIIV